VPRKLAKTLKAEHARGSARALLRSTSGSDSQPHKLEGTMRKVLGLTLALLLTLTLSAVAGQADRSIALEDGVTLSVADRPITDLAVGDQVPAMLEVQSGNIVSATSIESPQAE
jgi:hypothetical protein